MLREIVFATSNSVEREEALRGELLPFIAETEDKKMIFQQRRWSYSYDHRFKKLVSRFWNRIISIASIESWSGPGREPVRNFNRKI